MDIFFQATAAVLLTVILYLTLNGQNKELALLLTLAVCCLVIIVAGRFIQPVVVFLEELQKAGGLYQRIYEIQSLSKEEVEA
jgi:hypothetical protein